MILSKCLARTILVYNRKTAKWNFQGHQEETAKNSYPQILSGRLSKRELKRLHLSDCVKTDLSIRRLSLTRCLSTSDNPIRIRTWLMKFQEKLGVDSIVSKYRNFSPTCALHSLYQLDVQLTLHIDQEIACKTN